MAKFAGERSPLLDLREPFAIDSSGKIYDLSQRLILQQSLLYPSTSLADGTAFTGGTGTAAPFDPGATGLTPAPKGLLCGTTSTKFTLPAAVADCLSFTAPELTLSVWVSGTLHADKVGDLHEKSFIQSSGSHGVQFLVGNWDTAASPTASHFLAAAYAKPASAAAMNVVASTHKTAGKSGPSVWGSNTRMGYHGRMVQVTVPLPDNSNPIDATRPGWHHIAYIQRAARSPVAPPTQFLFGKASSPLLNTSQTGDEGRCEMWLDGELVYTTPAWGPFPEGHSPYFYEDGLAGLNGSTEARFLETTTDASLPSATTVSNRVIRQASPTAFLSGSSANGDATAQLSVWRRALSGEEISAIYRGTKQGVYQTPETSYSSAPKRLIDQSPGSPLSTARNVGFSDGVGDGASPAFQDAASAVERLSLSPYQGNFHYSPFGASTPASLTAAVMGDGSTIVTPPAAIVAFRDTADPTSGAEDPEYVIPSGSAVIRISIPNTDPNVAAGRSYNSGTVDTFSSQVGLDPTGSMCIGTGFLYYSPRLKRWVEKRADGATSFTADRRLVVDSASASNYILQVSASRETGVGTYGRRSMVKAGGTLAQFSWSPQFGYFFNHVEHLQQVGYSRIGWPTSFFGAPNAPKYHAYDHETIKLSDYIDRPFLLKRVELRVPVKSERYFGANPNYNNADDAWNQQVTNKKDIDNYVFFLYRQRRVSRERDGYLDRGTSKRYLIASASVCYYNSASFGGSFKDGFFNQPQWTSSDAWVQAISGALARPGDASDYFGQSLTQVSGNNPVLHAPAYAKEWGAGRFTGAYQDSELRAETATLNLTMFPTVVPDCQVSPSLVPFTGSNIDLAGLNAFAAREGGAVVAGSITGITGGIYVTTGSRASPTNSRAAPYLSLVSHRWFGGSRPAQIAASEAIDPYDTVRVPSNNNNDNKVRGSVDTNIHNTTSWVDDVKLELDSDGFTRYGVRLSRGSFQSQGLSLIPLGYSGSADPTKFMTQMPVDPQTVNSPVPAGGLAKPALRGRQTDFDDPNGFTTSHGGTYGGYYGWRFISNFQVGDFSEQQQYSPTLLDPQDELVLGLDAGTFGPPDLDADDLVADNAGPTAGYSPAGLGPSDTKRAFKNTHLKEDYRSTLPHSRLKILTGEAEIVLIGEFLQDGTPTYNGRSTPAGAGITRVVGDDPVLDRSLLYNLDLLSGTMHTRIFTGSDGPQGLIDGNSSPDSARRFFRDAGTRRGI